MPAPNFRRALVELDRELASVPFSGERRVRALAGSRRRLGWRLPALALAAAAIALLLVRARERDPAQVAGFTIDAPPSSWQARGDDVEVIATSLDLDVPGFGHIVAQRGARVARIDGGIRVVSGRVDVEVTHRAAGTTPALVRVSHGTIAVLGTRFTIEQSAHGGHVVLHEGRIRFESGAHSIVLLPGSSLTWPLAPGATSVATASSLSSAPPAVSSVEPAEGPAGTPTHFDRDVPPSTAAAGLDGVKQAAQPAGESTASPPGAPQPSTSTPSTSNSSTSQPSTSQPSTSRTSTSTTNTTQPPPQTTSPSSTAPTPPTTSPPQTTSPPSTAPTPTPPLDVDRLLADLANLRAKRRFADAAALLEQALATGGLSLATVERLSYELGDIRTHQLADRDRACRHWQAHRARFPQGRYTAEVAAAVRRLGCEETTP